MKTLKYFLAIILIVGLTATMVHAADVVLKAKITNMIEKTDRNGNQYIRFIVDQERELSGIKYTSGIPVLAFGATVEKARSYGVGDTLECIARHREYKSRESYTVMSFM